LNVERLLKVDISRQNGPAFRRALLRWYSKHGRDLPWRRTRDPYRILVSEFMLQQTQVATVLPYYKEWFRRFPNFAALARSSETDVIRAWQGLGYYARGRNLHAAAKLVVDKYRGRFPRNLREIRELPGIGKYTAHAVATFAFDQSVPIVEANTARVLARLFDLRIPIDSTAGQRMLWNRATSMVPSRRAGAYNSALLDLGALVCLPRNPTCGICPVKKFCRAKHAEALPVKRPRPQTKRLTEKHALVVSENKILLQLATDRWRGMWILPAANGNSRNQRPVYRAVFPFTNHRISLEIFRGSNRKIDKRHRWFSKRGVKLIPIPSPHRRAIEQLLANA
jgi:A/G-specific adenine glycosylase